MSHPIIALVIILYLALFMCCCISIPILNAGVDK